MCMPCRQARPEGVIERALEVGQRSFTVNSVTRCGRSARQTARSNAMPRQRSRPSAARSRLRLGSNRCKLFRLPIESQMTITVYHLETSRSERIVWLMEELRSSVRPAGLSARDHRRSSAPVEEKPRSRQGAGDPRRRHRLAESGAIVDYIVHRHGGGRLALSARDPGVCAVTSTGCTSPKAA